MSQSIKPIFAVALLLIVLGASSFGQTNTRRVVGTVNDESGAVLPGVEIAARNPSTGLSRTVVTNESGTYAVPLLPPAVYDIEARVILSMGSKGGVGKTTVMVALATFRRKNDVLDWLPPA